MENFLNQDTFRLIFSVSHRNVFFDSLIVFLATWLPYALFVALIWIFFTRIKELRHRLLFFTEISLAVLVSRGFLTETIRFFWPNPRPFLTLGLEPLFKEMSSSFPSSHAAVFFAIAMTLFYWNRRWGFWFFAFAGVNSIARIAAGVHWPLDIIGGILVGILGGIVIHALVGPYREAIDRHAHSGDSTSSVFSQ